MNSLICFVGAISSLSLMINWGKNKKLADISAVVLLVVSLSLPFLK